MRRPTRSARLAAAFVAAVLVAAAAAPAADEARALWRRNRRLAAEAAFAATQKPYFLLDLESRRIALMARGLVLFEVPVVQSGVWGRGLVIGPTAVVQRDALSRPAIRPGEEKTAETLEDQILELGDMPRSYRLHLAGDVTIEVRSLAEGRWHRWRQRLELWRWRLTRPLVTLRDRRERRVTTSAYVVLQPEDAQRLYWSFFEGLEGIVLPPLGR